MPGAPTRISLKLPQPRSTDSRLGSIRDRDKIDLETIAAPNALTGVAHNNTLTGNGTAASPLGVASISQDTAADRFWVTDQKGFGAAFLLSFNLGTTPVGKQLVVQLVSIHYSLASGAEEILQAQSNDGGPWSTPQHDSVRFFQPLDDQPTNDITLNAGQQVHVDLVKNSTLPVGNCIVAVSGRFVPAP